MKIDRQAFCLTLSKFGASITPSDLPGEIKELLDCLDYELENVQRYEDLIYEWRTRIFPETFERMTTDRDYEKDLKDLTSLFRNLLAKGYTTDRIDQLIDNAKGEV